MSHPVRTLCETAFAEGPGGQSTRMGLMLHWTSSDICSALRENPRIASDALATFSGRLHELHEESGVPWPNDTLPTPDMIRAQMAINE